jgi:hypothetical protein
VIEVFDADVAINAVEGAVDGLEERVGREEERYFHPTNRASGGGIKVAIETVRVGELLGRQSWRGEQKTQQAEEWHHTNRRPAVAFAPRTRLS